MFSRMCRRTVCLLRLLVSLGALSGVFAGSACAADRGDWWMFQHDPQHTGRSAFSGPSAPSLQWQYTTRSVVTSSAVIGADGTIYIGSDDNNLYAFNPDGTPKWQYAANGALAYSPALGADGTIYVGSEDFNLYAFIDSGASCTLKWKYATQGPIQSSPTIATDGTIYIGSDDGNLYALTDNGASCTLKWQYPTKGYIWSAPAIGANGTIYVGSSDNNLYALTDHGTSYTWKWQYAAGSGSWAPRPSARTGQSISGQMITTCTRSPTTAPPAHASGNMPRKERSSPARLSARTARSMSARKTITCMPSPITAHPARSSGNMPRKTPFSLPRRSVRMGRSTLGQMTATCTPSPTTATPARCSGNMPRKIPSSPLTAIGADGTLYFGSGDDNVYALTNADLTGVTLTTSLPSPEPAGTPITLSAAATGDTDVEYQFWAYHPAVTPAWSLVQAYSPAATCVWTPAAGIYLLSATAKDKVNGSEANTTAWYTVFGEPLTAITLTTAPTSSQTVNSPITLTAAATGGTDVQYQFWLYNPSAIPDGASCRPIPRGLPVPGRLLRPATTCCPPLRWTAPPARKFLPSPGIPSPLP